MSHPVTKFTDHGWQYEAFAYHNGPDVTLVVHASNVKATTGNYFGASFEFTGSAETLVGCVNKLDKRLANHWGMWQSVRDRLLGLDVLPEKKDSW